MSGERVWYRPIGVETGNYTNSDFSNFSIVAVYHSSCPSTLLEACRSLEKHRRWSLVALPFSHLSVHSYKQGSFHHRGDNFFLSLAVERKRGKVTMHDTRYWMVFSPQKLEVFHSQEMTEPHTMTHSSPCGAAGASTTSPSSCMEDISTIETQTVATSCDVGGDPKCLLPTFSADASLSPSTWSTRGYSKIKLMLSEDFAYPFFKHIHDIPDELYDVVDPSMWEALRMDVHEVNLEYASRVIRFYSIFLFIVTPLIVIGAFFMQRHLLWAMTIAMMASFCIILGPMLASRKYTLWEREMAEVCRKHTVAFQSQGYRVVFQAEGVNSERDRQCTEEPRFVRME